MDNADLGKFRDALRTPVNHIIGYAEIVREEAVDSGDTQAVERLDRILAAARRILDYVQAGDVASGLPEALLGPVDAIREAARGLRGRANGDIRRIEAAAARLERFARGETLDDAPASAMPDAPAEPAPFFGARVLVVEDDAPEREMLRRMLEREGFVVRDAASGSEALEMLQPGRFDLVLLDLALPDIDGFAVLAAVRDRPKLRSVPVIVLAAADDLGLVTRSIDEGAEDFVARPLDPVRLRVRILASLRRKRAEKDGRRTAECFRLLLDSAGEGIYGVDAAGRCTFANRATLEMLGYARDELVGRRLHPLIHHSRADGSFYPVEHCPVRQVLRTGDPRRVSEEMFFRADGSAFPVDYSAHPIVQDGEVQGAVVTFSDSTERRRHEERVRQAAKLESLGVLAGGVAHDFNNLLTGILGSAGLALEAMEPTDPNRNLLEEIINVSERAADLTRQLLAYAGKGMYMPEMVDLSASVSGIRNLLRTSIHKKIVLDYRLADKPPLVRADPHQMHQLVLNLVINAGEAIGDYGGRVSIETGTVRIDELVDAEPPFDSVPPGRYAYLAVEDSGPGMSEETRRHIFDPFFTTKFTGRGLGLSAAMGIVRSHGGAMRVETAPGRGSRFEVLLPALAGGAAVA